MTTAFRPFLFLLPFTFLAHPAGAQAPDPVFWEKAGDWDVFMAASEDGAFDVCFTTKELADDEMIAFYTDGTTATTGLFPTRWQLDERDTYPVFIQADDGTRISTQAIASADRRSVLFDVNLTPYILEFSGGRTFHLDTAAGRVSYDISGAKEAFFAMAYCALANRPDMQAVYEEETSASE